ncbi:MAG: hypothetical protein JRN15_18365 [Nitrososphaerota archaeon]|nr:hypothetical protein [Nitrososphaerota archaeon]
MAKGVGFWCLDSRKPTRSLALRGFAIGGDFFFNKKAANPILGAAFSQTTNTFRQRLEFAAGNFIRFDASQCHHRE